MNYVRREKHLSEGWRQRFEALVAGVDRERILSRMRVDGANWFVADAQELLPDLDDFDEDILKDEEVPEFGLSDDEGGSEMLLNADVETTETDTEMLDEYETDVQDTDEDEYAAYDDGAEEYEDADEYEEEDNE
jgi:hypothetical protein